MLSGKNSGLIDSNAMKQIDDTEAGILSETKLENMSDEEILIMLNKCETPPLQESSVKNAIEKFRKNLIKDTFNEEMQSIPSSNRFSESCGYDPEFCPFDETDCYCRAYIGSIIDDYSRNKGTEPSE